MQGTLRGSADPHLAVPQLIYRYCRALDRLDAPLLRSVFHEDAAIDLGSIYRGGVDGFVPVAMGFMGSMAATRHAVTNLVVEVLEPGEAVAEAYVDAWHRVSREDGEFELLVLARYLGRFTLRKGAWAIQRHSEVMDWGAERPAGSEWFDRSQELEKGRRDLGDASYAWLGRSGSAQVGPAS